MERCYNLQTCAANSSLEQDIRLCADVGFSSLPFCHFEREMEKNIELANGIGLGCREAILSEMKVLEK